MSFTEVESWGRSLFVVEDQKFRAGFMEEVSLLVVRHETLYKDECQVKVHHRPGGFSREKALSRKV